MLFRSVERNRYAIHFVAMSVVVFLANAGGSTILTMQTFTGVDNTGTIRGIASYRNGDPDTRIRMDAEPLCASQHSEPPYTETIVVNPDGHLANVFVYVKEGISASKFTLPDEVPILEQTGCVFKPHVLGVMTGQKLLIRNVDPLLHNVHALPKRNKQFNLGQPFQGMGTERTFTKPEIMVRFKCDIHPWMSAYVGVVDHPFFAVSDQRGQFTISSLPPGDYLLEAWHETLGTQTRRVTLKAEEGVEVSFNFGSER